MWEQPRLYVSLNKRGEIAINPAAWGALEKAVRVTLYYDKQTRQIGVKAQGFGERQWFPARAYGRGGRLRVVRAMRLLKQFGVVVETTLVFEDVKVTMMGKDPMLVLEMDKAERISRQ